VLIGPGEGMGHAGNGSLSPDGSLVTMMGHEIGGPGAIRFVANVDGTEVRSIPGGSSNPAGTWSPDGRRIVCSDYDGKDILVVDIATEETSLVAKGNGAIWLDRHTLLVEVS
jgi:Tol biopolymer transport system component